MSAIAASGPRRGGPLRFLGASVGGWVLTRIVIVAMFVPAAALVPQAVRELRRIGARPAAEAVPAPPPVPPRIAARSPSPRPAPVIVSRRVSIAPATPPVPELVGRFDDAILLAAYAPTSAHAFRRIDEGQAEAFAAPPGGRAPLPG
ncbi:MAG: hypothetical protein ABW173_01030, partial [Sphingomonas sp.]